MIKSTLLALAILFFYACTLTPMTVYLEPDTGVSPSDIGKGQIVYLSVYDERPEEDIGHRSSAMVEGATISLEQDLAEVVRSALSEMLVVKGFEAGSDESNNRRPSLRVDIRGLEYSISTGVWTGAAHGTAALKATANGKLEAYDNFYRFEKEVRIAFAPDAEANNEIINAALNGALQKLISDQHLLEVLASK